ncbi:MAG: hypothetical protein IMZ62_16555 [Chloroflexi bacterium]|nr:hypothetical protein [Chloroflexota bacterium]
MTRHGSCVQCGWCCNHIAFGIHPLDAANPVTKEWHAARGFVVKDGMVVVPHVCPHYVDGGCELHGDSKPQACKDAPFGPELLPATCGFTFTDK